MAGKRVFKSKRRAAPRRAAKKGRATGNSTRNLIRDNHAAMSCITSYKLDSETIENFSHNLTQHTRAKTTAVNYQEFKIDYVEFRVKPSNDTFAPGGFVAPQLYYQVLKDGSTMLSYDEFLQDGINAHSFSKDGNIVWRYKPSVVIAGEGGGSTILKTSPWLNTENTIGVPGIPNSVRHFGTSLFIRTDPQGAYFCATLDIEVHYLFRKPRYDLGVKAPQKQDGVAVPSE